MGRSRAFWWAAVAAWAGVIFAMSSLPGSSVPGRYGSLAHFAEYAVLGALLYVALRHGSAPVTSALVAALLASGYGISDELHQYFVPMRVPDVRDWAIDTAGALSAITVLVVIERLRGRKPQ